MDGSAFKSASPEALELLYYDVFRATGLILANWVRVDTISWNAAQWSGTVPVPGDRYYYRVVSRDITACVELGADIRQALRVPGLQ